MFIKALLLDIYFYNIDMNLPKYRIAGNFSILSVFLSNSKNQHICFHDNHGSNVGVGVVLFADSRRIVFSCRVYIKCIPVDVET